MPRILSQSEPLQIVSDPLLELGHKDHQALLLRADSWVVRHLLMEVCLIRVQEFAVTYCCLPNLSHPSALLANTVSGLVTSALKDLKYLSKQCESQKKI